ncbi:MAG TPA: PIN domain-containing protein [Acidimicrobiales bacterium]|nr:PIN domain-containing protein [Acidimicrobiales bacterium]
MDTGVLVAAAALDDLHHDACAELVVRRRRELVVPAGVVVEVAWLLGRRAPAGVEEQFLDSIGRGELKVEDARTEDYVRMGDLLSTYRDLRLDAVDAMVVAVAERLEVATVATVDRRDFSVIRPRHVAAFRLVPDLGAEAERQAWAPSGRAAARLDPPHLDLALRSPRARHHRSPGLAP